jgi:hypothetical protein
MAKFDLPVGSYIDVRFTFESAYDKESAKGNFTLAPESGKAEIIGFAGFEDMTAVFGKYGADRGKINFFAKLGKSKAKAPVAPVAPAPAKAPVAKAKAPAKAKAEPAPVIDDVDDAEMQEYREYQAYKKMKAKADAGK